MKYFSTSSQSDLVDFKEATILGQAPDRGLYFPSHIPEVDKGMLKRIADMSVTDLSFSVMQPYIADSIPENALYDILTETLNFPVPLVAVNHKIASLEMYHGPTGAFKDMGARFMSRCLGYFVRDQSKKITVLVATSGDTGGAVADGFYDVPGIQVVILFPSGKVSKVQKQQLCTLGKNILSLEVDGNFDDCQQLVKSAFADSDLAKKLFLTSANSINVARWLPQQLFYYFAFRQWPDKNNPPIVSVPSGNFGNICAGLLAMKAGLPITHFIAACNANDVVPDFFSSGIYQPKKAVPTLSNAMDVGDPSNFSRLFEIVNHDNDALKKMMSAVSITDVETASAMKELYEHYHYMADPHGAVAYQALKYYLKQHPQAKGIFAETAHPVKFYDTVSSVIHQEIPLPKNIDILMKKQPFSVRMPVSFKWLKDYLISLPV